MRRQGTNHQLGQQEVQARGRPRGGHRRWNPIPGRMQEAHRQGIDPHDAPDQVRRRGLHRQHQRRNQAHPIRRSHGRFGSDNRHRTGRAQGHRCGNGPDCGTKTRNIRTPQEDQGVHGRELPRELRPIGIRCHQGRRHQPFRRLPRHRRRRTVLQRQGHPDHHPDGCRQRRQAILDWREWIVEHPGRVCHHPRARSSVAKGIRCIHLDCQSQPRWSGGGFRNQVQLREWRTGHRCHHRAHLRQHHDHQEVQDLQGLPAGRHHQAGIHHRQGRRRK
mmetsp:Transcript_3163/g.8940  ORF Transcript_3163/g.8940 Transcript_3163/m.8940 type:complete len:275 (-) Transcript_3163:1383-2207(-)